MSSALPLIDSNTAWDSNYSHSGWETVVFLLCQHERETVSHPELIFSHFQFLLHCDYCNWCRLVKVNQSDYRKITIHSKMVVDQSAAFKKTIGYPKHKIKKNNWYSKRFLRKQNVSRDIVFLFKTLHITPNCRRQICLTQAFILSFTSNFFALIDAFYIIISGLN